MIQRNYIYAIVASSLLGVLPFLILYIFHGSYHVTPEFMDDSVYYYARMQAVAHGYLSIGNPYFIEHAREVAAAFVGADWLAAIPLVLGLPLLPGIILNAAVWFALFSIVSIWLLHSLGFSSRRSSVYALILVVSAFWYLERPVAMQVVYPTFILLLVTYLRWLQEPSSHYRKVFLAAAGALTFYIYTYEWQITTILFGISHLLLIKDWKKYRSLISIDVITVFLALPAVAYTAYQLQQPYYWETVRRIGFIETHTFGSSAFIVAAQLSIAGLGIWLICKRLNSSTTLFLLITGISIGIAAFSNVLTGKDLETAVHIGRFATLWTVVASLVILPRKWKHISNPEIGSALVSLVLLGIACFSTVSITRAAYPQALRGEKYESVLQWLRQNTRPGSVILANDELAYYIPAETQDYVLFQPDGGLYLLSDQELQDRYIASRSLSTTTQVQIEQDYRKYAGVGNAVHAYRIYNREVRLCEILHLKKCKEMVSSPEALRGEIYFSNLAERVPTTTEAQEKALRNFSVDYIILPKTTLPQGPLYKIQPAVVLGDSAIYALPK